jgi:nucleoside-diphosphate-sugar epimerase
VAQAALDAGHDVLGIDCLTDYYDRDVKRANLSRLARHGRFDHSVADLRAADLVPLIDGADVVHHLAGQPGVRLSWSTGFDIYVGHNVIATQRLLEAARAAHIGRLVYASSSSVYGNAARYPTEETDLPSPHSPYGVTKLAGEHLCALYAANWCVPSVVLRYFTVYGPGQRPDMGLHRFIAAAMSGDPIEVYGDGDQVRDFTYVEDVARATVAAGAADLPAGTVINVAGGSSITVNALLALVSEASGRELAVNRLPDQPGDVRRTGGSTERARRLLAWEPKVVVAEGLRAQLEWQTRSA